MTDLLVIPDFLRRSLVLPEGVTLAEYLRARSRASAPPVRRYKMPSGKAKVKKTVSRLERLAALERAGIEGRADKVIGDFGDTVK